VVRMMLANLLQNHLKKKKPEKPKFRSYFYVSEAGKRPYEIYKGLIVKQIPPPRIRRLMEIGTTTHKRVCKYLQEMGFLKASEVKIGDDLFHGYVDAITYLPYEKPMPLEIKTVNKRDFENILRKGMPTWQSYIQIQLYLNYLRKQNVGRILFIETNTLEDYVMPLEDYMPEQRMKEFIVRKNPRVIRQTLQKFRRLKEIFVRDGVMLR
jgi:hypothetical protein